MPPKFACKRLDSTDLSAFAFLMKLFGEVFAEKETYQAKKPSEEYIRDFLSDSSHIILISLDEDQVIGGLAAYELKKFEQERSEFYIYDLAVLESYQRKGVGTALVEKLKDIARSRGVKTIFVQADKADQGAISFYKSLNAKPTDTYNFDLEIL